MTEPQGWRAALGALRHRDFRLIAIGNFISQLGYWGQYVAAGWAARSLTHTTFLITLTFSAPFIPTLVLSPVAGVLADRYDRRRLVLWGNIAMVLPPAAIGVLQQTHRLTITSLILLIVLGGVGQAFTQPAATAYIPALVPPEDLHSAISLNSGLSSSTRVVGPSIAGFVIAAWGVGWGFYINAISFLAVAIACVLVHIRPPAAASKKGMLTELRLGLAYIRQNQAVGRLTLLISFQSFWLMHAGLMPIIVRDVLHGDAATYGLLSSAPGVGFVGAAVLTPLLTSDERRHRALAVCSFALAGAIVTLGLSRVIPLTLLSLGLFGLTYMSISMVITTMLMRASTDEYRGRVMGVYSMFSVGVFPVNSLLAGVLGSWLGAPGTVLLCGIAIGLFSVAFFGTRSLDVIRAGTGTGADTDPAATAAATL